MVVVTSLLASSGTFNLHVPIHLHYTDSYLPNRSFLKAPGRPNIPIQAIGLSLYEQLGTDSVEEVPGTKVTRLQWLDMNSSMANLLGKNVLIVDEVDDTRTTLQYAVKELEGDVKKAQDQLPPGDEKKNLKTNFFVFVLHVCFLLSLWRLMGLTNNWNRTRTSLRRVSCPQI